MTSESHCKESRIVDKIKQESLEKQRFQGQIL